MAQHPGLPAPGRGSEAGAETPGEQGPQAARVFGGIDDPGYGVVRFTPYRIALEDVSGRGERRIVWRDAQLLALV